ncbi:MAG: hypothetical protein CMJ46_05045 [Planctomyces sp.]|nr:hypothetical protein [Planctomyces sp.]
MTHSTKLLFTFALLATGYGLGLAHESFVKPANAQDEAKIIPAETVLKLRNGYTDFSEAQQSLIAAGNHEVSLSVVNTLAVGAGGTRSLQDLQRGTGVDPFTFGALYAGLADPGIQSEVSFDERGRLMYRNKLVRLYSPDRMKKLFEDYAQHTAGK